VIYLGVAVTGVLVARSSQEMRTLYLAVEQNQGVRDQLLAQYSRLLLERSTLSSYQNVDEIAEQTLDMRFPERVERVTQ
jgi:cell division protein FtsL